MPDNDEYKTLQAPSEGVYKEKASKFIGLAFPVYSEAEATSALNKVKKEYFDANHHCYAFRLGTDGKDFRYSDDREPSGTAGRPIYGEMLSAGITNVLIVVVRYFGGTKLGTSGLIRAYKAAAHDAIENGIIITAYDERFLDAEFDYGNTSEIMRIIKEEGLKVTSQKFDQLCHLRVIVRKSSMARVIQRLRAFCTSLKPDN